MYCVTPNLPSDIWHNMELEVAYFFSVSYKEQTIHVDEDGDEYYDCEPAGDVTMASIGSEYEDESISGIAKLNIAMSHLDKRWQNIPDPIPNTQRRKYGNLCTNIVLDHLGTSHDIFESPQKDVPLVKKILHISSDVDAHTRTQLLSLVVTDHTEQQLKALAPDQISRHKINAARRHAALVGPGLPVSKPKIVRERMPNHKILHFVDFVTMPAYTQMVAVGTKSMTLESGENIIMPYVIRNQRNSEIIKEYVKFCESINFSPLCTRTLYKILEICPASRRKSKKCLDNYQADGEEGFNTLEEVCYRFSGENLIAPLRTTRQHLQGSYARHISKDSKVADHCITHSLSEKQTDGPFSKACNHVHDQTCAKCSAMFNTLKSVEAILEKARSELQDLDCRSKIHDGEVALEKIHEWRRHVVRTVNQQMSKSDFLADLKDNQVFIIQV